MSMLLLGMYELEYIMNTDMLRNLLYEHRDSPDLLLEAYKRGCRDERAAARLRGENEIQRLTAILRRNEICTKCGETTFDGECQCSNPSIHRMAHGQEKESGI